MVDLVAAELVEEDPPFVIFERLGGDFESWAASVDLRFFEVFAFGGDFCAVVVLALRLGCATAFGCGVVFDVRLCCFAACRDHDCY
jgi:hypothetical protein